MVGVPFLFGCSIMWAAAGLCAATSHRTFHLGFRCDPCCVVAVAETDVGESVYGESESLHSNHSIVWS